MLFNKDMKYDSLLLYAMIALVMIGLLMIYSASSIRAEEKYDDATLFLKYHLFRVVIGVLLMFLASKIDYQRYRFITPFLFLGLIVLLILVFFSPTVNGSRRALAFLGKDFQPSELMKLGIIFYLAALFGKKWKGGQLPEDKVMVHYIIMLAVVGLVLLEPDLGTSLVMFSITIIMFFLGGVRWQMIGKMLLSLIPLVAVGLVLFSYQMRRITDFFQSISGAGELSYQIKQSIMGLANGGFAGVGYGSGTMKLFFLPEPFSDFILASLGEEFGFAGILVVFTLLAIILWRGVRIAVNAPDKYGMLLAGGITFLIMVSALFNAGVVVNLIPTTGLPFPFLSYGGSSLIVLMTGVGIMLNISKENPVTLKDFTQQRAKYVNSSDRRY